MIAAESKTNLEMRDGLSISDKTKQAFAKLENQGIIPLAKGHTFSECTQPYKEPTDVRLNIDAAAVVGMDEQQNVPQVIQEELAESSTLGTPDVVVPPCVLSKFS